MRAPDAWAVLPVKEFAGAKQRLAPLLTPAQRRALAAAMVEDVLAALAGVADLAGILVVTLEPVAAGLARRYGATVSEEGARDGHTGAVAAAARALAGAGRGTMLALPGDIPAITAAEVAAALRAHRPAPAFTIVPSHDERGSNTVICSPPEVLPLRFGDDSFLPHLAAARGRGIEPTVLRQPGIAMDIDHPADLAAFLRTAPAPRTRTRALLEQPGFAAPLSQL
ncbi:MAG: 2-phospho-L-lactate guanylyltransferase [Alphaproteobacteria bacterium]|nr:2-phospho-L-lactate guanylyltransferase [Alphaproteobacteria bacterium]